MKWYREEPTPLSVIHCQLSIVHWRVLHCIKRIKESPPLYQKFPARTLHCKSSIAYSQAPQIAEDLLLYYRLRTTYTELKRYLVKVGYDGEVQHQIDMATRRNREQLLRLRSKENRASEPPCGHFLSWSPPPDVRSPQPSMCHYYVPSTKGCASGNLPCSLSPSPLTLGIS